MTNTPAWWECDLVGLQEKEEEVVGGNIGQQLIYWAPMFYSLFSSCSHVSESRQHILTHSCHFCINQWEVMWYPVEYHRKRTIYLVCCMSFYDVCEKCVKEKQSMWQLPWGDSLECSLTWTAQTVPWLRYFLRSGYSERGGSSYCLRGRYVRIDWGEG